MRTRSRKFTLRPGLLRDAPGTQAHVNHTAERDLRIRLHVTPCLLQVWLTLCLCDGAAVAQQQQASASSDGAGIFTTYSPSSACAATQRQFSRATPSSPPHSTAKNGKSRRIEQQRRVPWKTRGPQPSAARYRTLHQYSGSSPADDMAFCIAALGSGMAEAAFSRP
jgi:hypothetical protein